LLGLQAPRVYQHVKGGLDFCPRTVKPVSYAHK